MKIIARRHEGEVCDSAHIMWEWASNGRSRMLALYFTFGEDRRSKCFCPCGHEILQDLASKIYEGGTFTNIICSRCNRQTTWDLNAPAPILLKVSN